MIIAALPHIISLAIGWFVVYAFLSSSLPRSTWVRLLITISLGYAVGMGITSCVYFVLVATGAASRTVVLLCEASLLVGSVVLFLLNRGEKSDSTPFATPVYVWLLRGAFLLAVVFSIASWSTATNANPHGDWDATAIWNLRARFLSSAEPGWKLAIAPPSLGTTIGVHHPTYPILIPSATAQAWTLTGTQSSEVPALASLGFALAVAMLLAGAIAWEHSESLGLLAGLVFLASDAFITNSPAQYADIPLSLYVLGSLVALEIAAAYDVKPRLAVLAGVCAGFTSLTKNEGIVFVLIFLAVAAWRLPLRKSLYVLAGSAPAIALTVVFKLFLSQGRDASLPATATVAIQRATDMSRWMPVIKGYLGAFVDMGTGITHPLLLIAVLCVVLRFVPTATAWRILCSGLPAITLLAATAGVHIVTNNDLQWQLDTSVDRVVAQVWPTLLWMVFLLVRAPERLTVASPVLAPEPTLAVKAGKRKKRS